MPGAVVLMADGAAFTVKSGGRVSLHHGVRIVPMGTISTAPLVNIESGGEIATVHRIVNGLVSGAPVTRVAEQSEDIVVEPTIMMQAKQVCMSIHDMTPRNCIITIASLVGSSILDKRDVVLVDGQECLTISTAGLARGVYLVQADAGVGPASTLLVLH